MEVGFPRLAGGAGRLGNQLWEIAGSIGLARKLGFPDPKFPEWDYMPYFQVPQHLFGHDMTGVRDISDFATHIDPRARVYLQDYNLWKDIEDEIWTMFQPTPLARRILDQMYESYYRIRDHTPLLSLNVRRGDNVTHPVGIHPLRTMTYFKNAVERIDHDWDMQVVVVSDDIPWCKDHIEPVVGRRCVFLEGGLSRPHDYNPRAYKAAPAMDWTDLLFMTDCEHHIISNSTYAWWGAFLAASSIVIYPTNWFGYQLDYIDASLMFPSWWTEMEDLPIGRKL